MQRHWTAHSERLEIAAMPFYWRLSDTTEGVPGIAQRLPVRLRPHAEFDFLELDFRPEEWAHVERAYRRDANIGFLNPESGQINTYGSSVNNFLLEVVQAVQPRRLYEIGCGAGFSIMFLRERGWSMRGIDPSAYSRAWSGRLGFELINEFFAPGLLTGQADLIFCNDVFEHLVDVCEFARHVHAALQPGGTFCFATTNSSRSIGHGDISMLEHQHVNSFSERAIQQILLAAGFGDIRVGKGSYGNTFHVVARKADAAAPTELAPARCPGYFERAQACIEAFAGLYERLQGGCHFYVPLRALPYLACVGDHGRHEIFDSNVAWRGRFIDGYGRAMRSAADVDAADGAHFFVASLTFFEEIKKMLEARGVPAARIHGVADLLG